jgi:DNA adenine methylase
MHYLGSKARHAAAIIEFTQSKRKPGQTYVEPFVGGGNMMCRVPADLGPRIGNDYNFHMVQLLEQLANHGWLPPETMTQAIWTKIAKAKPPAAEGPEAALYAFAATGPTFGSVWFGAWAKDYPGQEGNRYRQARDAAIKDQPGLAGVKFYHAQNGGGDFRNLTINGLIPPECVIYCDPPYVGTTGYDGAKETIKVDEDPNKNTWKAKTFWKWADALVDAGHTVYASEYKGPLGGDVYGSLPRSEEEKAVGARLTALQKDASSSSADITELQNRLQAFKFERTEQADLLAARWQVLWEKEVVSDFSATRGDRAEDDGTPAGKVETEKLFHRAA